MAVANSFLAGHFITDYNRRFAIDPEVSQRAWRKVVKTLDIERAISFCYQAAVGNDNTVRLGGIVIDIPEAPTKEGMPRQR